MSEEDNALEQRKYELKAKYDKLVSYALTIDDFIWVYRAEGEKDLNITRSGADGTNKHLVGSWFTPSFDKARDYKSERSSQDINDIKLYAVAIPKDMFISQDDKVMLHFQGGMINLSENFINAKVPVESPLEEPPTRDSFINQFDYVKEYRQLTGDN